MSGPSHQHHVGEIDRARLLHPEATETMIRRWANSEGGTAELLKYGIKPDDLIDDARRNVADSQPAAEHIVDWFLDRVAGS